LEQLSIDLTAGLADGDAPGAGLRLTSEQQQAVRARDRPVLLSAAAGSGKTSVLVERFVQAVREDGLAPGAILAITFTERAAGELRSRVRERLLELGMRGAARDTEAAFIGTFHGFCARLLRSHPLPAGLDPDFTVLDAARAAWLRRRAFDDALPEFLGGDAQAGPAVDLLAAYGVDKARAIVGQLHAELRSRGERRPRLPLRAPDASAERDERDALSAVALFDRLLELFGASYERLKGERSAVDFDDLELIAGELLSGNAPVRTSWAESFELLMVDEFQDTNPRQLAILRSLDRGNLFTVGDELQSIYGFRHADVRLFRERRAELEAAGGVLALTSNFRSAQALVETVNAVFEQRFEQFTRLVHGREEVGPPVAGPLVELLLTDAGDGWSGHPGAEAIASGLPPTRVFARQAEARLLAQRVRELVDAGETRAGEVAVLLRAGGDIETFERALQLQGLRTLASVGTFWERQQIADMHAYLRTLANPRDEEALYGTLASPLAGLSRDALALLAISSAGRPVWETARALAAAQPAELGDSDQALLARFCGWFEAERRTAAARGISELLEHALAHSGYVEHVMRLDWPERRLANIHKLLRLARAFEAAEGRDLRAFVDHVEDLKRDGAIEPEAPVEDVEPDTVRLMTIHAAKGLEFPVVCLADLGRRRPSPDDRLFVDGPRLGLRLWRPGQGEGIKTLDFDELRAERQAREREEESRVFYVAMTRARERLILSGIVDFASWPKEGDTAPPISWLGPALYPRLTELLDGGPAVATVPAGGNGGPPVRVTLSGPDGYGEILRKPPERAEAAPPGDAAVALLARSGAILGAGSDRRPVEDPARTGASPTLPSTLSYTSLSLLERCGYRYYLERVLRLPEQRPPAPAPAAEGLEARARGTLVHRLLETHAFGASAAPQPAQVAAAASELRLTPEPSELEQIAALLGAALASPLARRIAAAPRRHPEHPFAFSPGAGAPLVTGVLDVLCEEADGTALVVDYKSDRLPPGADAEQLVARDYAVQRLLYALAVLRQGALVVEVAHWFLEQPDEPAMARYTLADLPELEVELARRLAMDWEDPYAVSPRPHLALCLSCPGRGGMCSWSEQETLREEPREPDRPPPKDGSRGQ
jgi:ATP-dependent exoDNAse (exonuclease V) beta subunit